jgi:hypothetical protein
MGEVAPVKIVEAGTNSLFGALITEFGVVSGHNAPNNALLEAEHVVLGA